jgi:hypothetical protein
MHSFPEKPKPNPVRSFFISFNSLQKQAFDGVSENKKTAQARFGLGLRRNNGDGITGKHKRINER